MNMERRDLHFGEMLLRVDNYLAEEQQILNRSHLPSKRWQQLVTIQKKREEWYDGNTMEVSDNVTKAYLYRLMKNDTKMGKDKNNKYLEQYNKWKRTKVPYEYCWLAEDNKKISHAYWISLVNKFGIDWLSHPMAKRNTVYSVYDIFGQHVSIATIMHKGHYILRLYQCRQTTQTVIKYITYDPRKPSEWILNMDGDRYKDVPELVRWRAYGQPTFEKFLEQDKAVFHEFITCNWTHTETLSQEKRYESFCGLSALRWVEKKFSVVPDISIGYNINLNNLHTYGW